MNPLITVVTLIFLLSSCQNNTNVQNINTEENNDSNLSTKKANPMTVESENDSIQYLDIIRINEDPTSQNRQILSKQINLEQIKFNGVKFKDTKSKILEMMGSPDSIINPNYECGPFSQEWQNQIFLQYFYSNMNFIVYEDSSEIQNIKFVGNEKLQIGKAVLNNSLDFGQVVKLLKIIPKELPYSKEIIELYPIPEIDEYYFLEFKNGKLYKFDRYQPC